VAIPDRAHLVRQSEVALALRRHGPKGLRALATERDGRAYLYVPVFLTWEKARAMAEAAGGHLMFIHDDAEQRNVEAILESTSWWIWMGVYQTDRELESVTGEPVSYVHVADRVHFGQPGAKVFAGYWLTQHERDFENGFVIQWDA
jgi:hypothetical protein